MRCYTAALRACLREDSGGARGEHVALLYSNRAHAYSKMGDHLKVIALCPAPRLGFRLGLIPGP